MPGVRPDLLAEMAAAPAEANIQAVRRAAAKSFEDERKSTASRLQQIFEVDRSGKGDGGGNDQFASCKVWTVARSSQKAVLNLLDL